MGSDRWEAESVRDHLVRALEADLVGPYALDDWKSEEVLKLPPSRWYLTGFLAPEGDREDGAREDKDPTEDEGFAAGDDDNEEEGSGAEADSKRKNFLPASMGLTVLLPPGERDVSVRATVRFAEYVPETREQPGAERPKKVWRRVAREPISVEVPLAALGGEDGLVVPNTSGLRLVGKVESVPTESGLPAGSRALSLFLVNRRAEGDHGERDAQYLFQVTLELERTGGFLARPNVAFTDSEEWDEKVADLQFRNCCEYAVGHNASAEVAEERESTVTRVRTTWIPRVEVRRVKTHDEPGIETSIENLAAIQDAAAVRAAVGRLPDAYGDWIAKQRAIALGDAHDARAANRAQVRDQLMNRADRARARIAGGIALLERDDTAREAFVLTNRAMAHAARKRRPGEEPHWRLFQLAFVLLNLRAIAEPEHEEREDVELIFFPTGGGKTEAYLGVIAFTLLLRRLRGRSRPDQGLGTAVLLRYTLRLLTLDQLGRAATLVCALELLRRQAPDKLGDVRFSVGLWVGLTATPNQLSDAAKRVTDYKNGVAGSPCPLTECPWCDKKLVPASLQALPSKTSPEWIRVACVNDACEFCASRDDEGLPVLFVDEHVYREAPSFLIGTVDKFAMLPWRGETGMLFGRVNARLGRAFYGPMDGHLPPKAERLAAGLLPPELIVQDELHLISGPLGTMVGLYETAIDLLCTRAGPDGKPILPKVLAATATVRRADKQVQALFGRSSGRVNLFPPPGVDDSQTFFAVVDEGAPGRLYVGVAAQGRAMRRILSRVYSTLLGASMSRYEPGAAPEQTADGYLTLAGYFNSLRELGGMRRIVEDEVRERAGKLEDRRPLDAVGPHLWSKNRANLLEPIELTSRARTQDVSRAKARLKKPYADRDERVDVLLASNMISVGVDIDRLGLMVIAGQPKTTAEYIQASSRVGRQTRWPGLVVTCLNVHKPRDRSHYERFVAYHESFYRFVEATSVTPFSGPALDRGLAGTLVAMTRLLTTVLTAPKGVMALPEHAAVGETALLALVARAARQLDSARAEASQRLQQAVEGRGRNLLDAWKQVVDVTGDAPAKRSYSQYDRDKGAGKPLLYTALDEEKPAPGTDDAKFCAPTSMRDVEPVSHLWIMGRKLGRRT